MNKIEFDKRQLNFVEKKLNRFDNKFPTKIKSDNIKETFYRPKELREFFKVELEDILDRLQCGRICIKCGADKETDLSDWCSDCLENE